MYKVWYHKHWKSYTPVLGSFMSHLFHIARRTDWEAAQLADNYRPVSLDTEGFIHCSTAAQLLQVANAFYRGQQDLLLLRIDPDHVAAPLRYEAPAEAPTSAERFPHIYGALNCDAVVGVQPFVPNPDGTFAFPRQAPQ